MAEVYIKIHVDVEVEEGYTARTHTVHEHTYTHRVMMVVVTHLYCLSPATGIA